nr:EOG090X0IUZ [Scapholeberis mucronata]
MIPLTNKVLHDPHEKVRAEYVSMLTKAQKVRIGKLWEVIDVNHLIVRLAIDTSKTVCRRLVVLLTPFFYPKGSSSEVIFQRCLRLVMDNRIASRKFYQHAHSCVGVEQLAQLILIIWKFLRNYVNKQLEKNKIDQKREESASNRQRSRPSKRSRRGEETGEPSSSMTEEDKENKDLSSDNEGDEVDSQSDGCSEASIIGLIDVVCILLSENKSKLKSPPHTVLWENIKSRFNKTCSLFFRYFKNTEGLRSLIFLYGLMSSTSSPHMLSFVKSQLKSLNEKSGLPVGRIPGVEYPLTVLYCGNCGLPTEYCEFYAEHEKCKQWFEKNLPSEFAKQARISIALSFQSNELDEQKETEDDKKRQKRGGKGLSKPKKKEGGPKKICLSVAPRGRKRLTCVVGLKSYDIDLKVAAKFFGTKFACGASVTGDDEIVIQGDVKDDLFDLLPEKWPQIDEDSIDDLGEVKR